MSYIALINEIEKRIDEAIKNRQHDVVNELKDLLHWIKVNC